MSYFTTEGAIFSREDDRAKGKVNYESHYRELSVVSHSNSNEYGYYFLYSSLFIGKRNTGFTIK